MTLALDPRPSPAYTPETPWRPLPAFLVVLLAAIAPVALGLAALVLADRGYIDAGGATAPDEIPSLSSPFILVQMIVGQLLSLAIIWTAAGWRGARAQTLRLGGDKTNWAAGAVYGVLLIALITPIELALYRLAGIDLFADGQWILEGLRSPFWWAVIVAAVVMAPIWEEVTFRGFLLSALAKTRLGYWPAAVLSATVWTLLHIGYSWPGLVSVFLAGLGLSWVMLRTGSMRAVVAAHAVVNAFSLTVIFLFGQAA